MKDKLLHEPYIIESSGNVSAFIRIRDLLLTIAMWALFFYLLRDFYIFIGDIYHWLHDGTGTAKAYPKLRIFHTLQEYLATLAVMATIFVAWPVYNRLRFASKTRRKAVDPVTNADMAKFYRVEPKQLAEWLEARSMTVYQDADGRVSKVKVAQ